MFGKRTTPPSSEPAKKPEVSMPSIAPEASTPAAAPSEASTRQAVPKIDINEPAAAADGEGGAKINQRIEAVRERIWRDVRESLDLKNLASMEVSKAREEVQAAVAEIVRYRAMDLTKAEIIQVSQECADDMLGFGPLEPLLARDDIADIMINGPDTTYIEVKGKIEKAEIRFRDAHHLLTICQRIVGAIGRRVDESSPICDARLLDGSRVNVIIPPLSVDGASMTIRKFKKDKLTLDKLVEFGAMTPACAKLIMAIGRSRLNVLVSGGTGSGKTTMLNCLTRYIDKGERVITCEDACELQLQQPHVVRLETRPPNLEGVGEVTMRDLVRNCLRMRPERIIVGEVRGPEAFDLLQAMNTGHDGSMGTVHANNPREAISRMENMIAMAGLNIGPKAVREQIASAVNVIIQVQRLRDGSRKVTHVSEITGMEGEVVTMQDLFTLEIEGEDEYGRLIASQKSSGLRPRFYDRFRQFNMQKLADEALGESLGA
ncbi:MAG: CpaF family protein [Rhodospirillales bacterium]|nr:CpaF family protein [Rhodospirillales bacterium]USO07257.1 MAG: CpaF family protein [Rhodospirillales bacterium]